MSDPELEAIRKQRLAQLQSQYGGGGEDQQKAQEDRAKLEETKHMILQQVLNQAARARLNTIKISKPEKADMIEKMICQMAQTGQIRGQIDETQLIGLLESINKQMSMKQTSVKFDRRRAALDSDDDDL